MILILNLRNDLARRHFYFALFVATSLLAYWSSVKQLLEFVIFHDYASHILLIAPLSILLAYRRRRKIFSIPADPKRIETIIAGSGLFVLGLIFLLAGKYPPLGTEKLSLDILSLVALWIAAFTFCFGTGAFVKAQFPLLFLLLMVPIPEFVVDKVIFALQAGSSDVAYGLFRLLNVPVLKDGFILRLPMLNLEVAKECSGIRSSIALLVTMLVVAELVLRSPARRVLLVIAIVPMLVIKNGVRIVTIYLLAAYLNPAFLHGWLHTSGGIVFYLLGFLALIPVVVLLRRGESRDFSLRSIHKLATVTSA